MTDHHRIRVARVYDEAGPDDGFRVLVDGVWMSAGLDRREMKNRLCRPEVEFAVPHTPEERLPLRCRNPQYGSGDVLAVAHSHLPVWQICDFNAIPICVTQGALGPD